MSDWRKVDKKIAFLSQFKANEPAPTSAEKMGPPSPWELYRSLYGPLDSFRFKRMTHEGRCEALQHYRNVAVSQEMVHERALAAAEARARLERERERAMFSEMESQLGAW